MQKCVSILQVCVCDHVFVTNWELWGCSLLFPSPWQPCVESLPNLALSLLLFHLLCAPLALLFQNHQHSHSQLFFICLSSSMALDGMELQWSFSAPTVLSHTLILHFCAHATFVCVSHQIQEKPTWQWVGRGDVKTSSFLLYNWCNQFQFKVISMISDFLWSDFSLAFENVQMWRYLPMNEMTFFLMSIFY